MKLIPGIILSVFLTSGFSPANAQSAGAPGPHLLVYKTKKDYRQLVPVLLSDDRKSIVSYPDPSDIKAQGTTAIPTQLKSGYLIDNRGIGENVAFLKMSYKEYAKLKSVPTVEKLYGMIKDKDPLIMLCDCGLKRTFKNPKAEVNAMIDKKTLLTKCKVLKQATVKGKK
jgi:hypothetical protein